MEQEKTEEAYEKLENVDTICDFQKSRLYKHIKFQDAENPYAEEMKKELIAGFQNEEDFAYMKGYKPWKKLLAKYWFWLCLLQNKKLYPFGTEHL